MNYLQNDDRNAVYRAGVDIGTIAAPPEPREQIFSEHSPEPAEIIALGLCINCDNLGQCVWQHNNKINCQHFQ